MKDREDLNVQFLPCRTLGHAWEVDTWNAKQRTLTLGCSRCEAVRTESVSGDGAIAARHYKYLPGYLKRADEQKLPRTAYRSEFLLTLGRRR